MSILDNEGHDPNGLGNTPSRTEIEQLRAENAELRLALGAFTLSERWSRQETEIERLTAALQRVVGAAEDCEPNTALGAILAIARGALEPKP
jgi:hypothetical protein